MRRSARASVLVAAALSCSAVAISAQEEEHEVYRNQDEPTGVMSVEVPAGAAPPDTEIEIVRRPAEERPSELDTLPIADPFYELRPVDVSFAAPVRVTRAIDLAQLGIGEFDPSIQGYPVASLFTKDPTGAWSWLADAEVRFDSGGDGGPSFLVTGTSNHGGPYFGYLGGSLVVVPDEPSTSTAGELFRIEAQLHGPPGTEAKLATVIGETSDASVATFSDAYEVELFESAMGIELGCVTPGAVTYALTFDITGIAENGALGNVVDGDGATVGVLHEAEHTCLG